MDAFRFQSITTEELLELVRTELPGALEAVNAPRWIDGEGVPGRRPGGPEQPARAGGAAQGAGPAAGGAATGRPWEWQVYLNQLPRPAPPELMTTLEERFHLTEAPNPEVLVAWLTWRFAAATRRRCAGPRRCSARSAG